MVYTGPSGQICATRLGANRVFERAGRGGVVRAIRAETPGDFSLIDQVHRDAFGSVMEGYIVREMRENYPLYDPAFSLTAWSGDELVGHVLFSPACIRLGGRTVKALALGPIAVRPSFQGTGVGGALIERGHSIGRAAGFALCLLYGHPSYYPRHGYVPCFGFGEVCVDPMAMPAPQVRLTPKVVEASDLLWLAERHAVEWADVDFAWVWGGSVGNWTTIDVPGTVWWSESGTRAGYTVAHPVRGDVKLILAEDPEIARALIATTRPTQLVQHPDGWLARNVLDPSWGLATARASTAAMACPLQEGVLDELLAGVKTGDRLPGTCVFPLPFFAE
jgi:putative acetyltransferase